MIRAVAVTAEVGGAPRRRGPPPHLSVAPGQVVAVIGPSGSGKSTLLRILTGVQAPTTGNVMIDGAELTRLSVGARAAFRRDRLGVVFQDPELLDELSVAENAALPIILAGRPRGEALSSARVQLSRVGLASHGDGSPKTLSRGEAMRVAVARALVAGPRAVIADEPTASLDRTNALAIARMLVDNARAMGAATVVASHDPEVVAMCDDIVDLRSEAQVTRS